MNDTEQASPSGTTPVTAPGPVRRAMPGQSRPPIVRQSRAFFPFGCDKEKKQPATPGFPLTRMTVLKDKKRKILRELDMMGINEATLFPEIENVAHYLKQHA